MPRPENFIPLKAEYYTAVGRVAMEWTAIEGVIAYGVRTFMGPSDSIGRTVTAHTQFLTNCEILRSLLHLRVPQFPDQVRALSKLIDDLSMDKPNHDDPSKKMSPRTRRNEIIHGSWVEAGQPPRLITVTYKARGKLKHRTMAHSASTLNAFADELGGLCDQLWDALMPLLKAYMKTWRAS